MTAVRETAERMAGISEQLPSSPAQRTPASSKAGTRVVQRDKRAEARDRWLHGQAKKKKPPTWKALMAHLNRIADKRRWRKLSSAQAVVQAVDRYIQRNGLDPLPPRKQA
jgi:hypothetical protein